MNSSGSWQVGLVEIVAPDPGRKQFWIYADVAKLFGCEYTSDAVASFRAAWKAQEKKGRVDVDPEADGVSFAGGRQAILQVAALLNDLATVPVDRQVFERQMAVACVQVKAYVVPKPLAWELGDVFAFKLRDGSFAYGQVVGDLDPGTPARQPTCALFDCRTPQLSDLDVIRPMRPVSVLHVLALSLDSGQWRIIGRHPVQTNPYAGPCGHPREVGGTHWDGLETLANAYFGLEPWNVYYKDDYLDRYLLAGVERPAVAIMLDDAALAERGITRPKR